ncbi:MFS transporter [Patulibacter minatonensis]|uniref:MFS transporter n=1 Tax=Patulibacter minatonensis TaxID=298163 RepID=UPI001FDF6ABE|nr:MFS transporter [Patulibacter minatonensis]
MSSPTPTTRAVAPVVILLLACVAQFMLILDDTIVNVALPTVGEDLGFSERDLSWVVNAYFLTFGGFLLIGGRIADRVGARRMFTVSLAAFAAASAVCGAAWSPEVLVGARAVQGLAAAMLSPAALAILLATYAEGPGRSRALAAWASLIGLGAATGLLAGGAITEALDWRWVFLINLPVAAIALALVPRVIPKDDLSAARTAPNVLGALLGTASLLLLVFTVVETDGAGWTSARTLAGFGGVLVLAALFAVSEARSASPLLPRTLLRRRQPMIANGLVLLAAGGLMAMFFFQTLFMQRVLGYGALQTGLSFLPFSVSMGLASVVTGRFLTRVDPRLPVAGGMLLAAVGLYLMSTLTPESSYVGHLAPSLVLTAYGVGTAFVVVMEIATGGAEDRDGGLASAMLTTGQQIGAAIGIAAMVTIATTRTGDELARGTAPALAATDGFTAAFHVMMLLMVFAAVATVAFLRPSGERARAAARPTGRASMGAAD